MDRNCPKSLFDHFSVLVDGRYEEKCLHKLIDVIVIAIVAVICGADEWTGIEKFGKAKEAWFRRFLDLDNGIPSHDTFGRVFALLSPRAFEAQFQKWVQSVSEIQEDQIIAIDGKTLRRSHDRKSGKAPIHMVSAWASANRVVLGQRATEAKSNEIRAIPQLLETLLLRGCIVTIDAMGCQKKIARQIIEQGGDYVLALKGNQSRLADEVEEAFIDADARDYAGVRSDFFETTQRGHGRTERRRFRTLSDLDGLSQAAQWSGLNVIAMVESQREHEGKRSTEYRYYIGSIGNDARRLGEAVRAHWGIENDLHWSLDVAFREDESRVRNRNAAENFAVLRHIALGLLKNEKTAKVGIKTKRQMAGWDERYLAKLLFQQDG